MIIHLENTKIETKLNYPTTEKLAHFFFPKKKTKPQKCYYSFQTFGKLGFFTHLSINTGYKVWQSTMIFTFWVHGNGLFIFNKKIDVNFFIVKGNQIENNIEERTVLPSGSSEQNHLPVCCCDRRNTIHSSGSAWILPSTKFAPGTLE